jgi:hypothetical protein
MTFLALLLLAAAPSTDAGSRDAGSNPPPKPILELLESEAKAYSPQVKSPWVKRFLELTSELPSHPPRVFFHTPDKKVYFTGEQAAKLPEAERKALVRREVDDEVYYSRITEPLAYARPFDLLAAKGFKPTGQRVLDFGYGNIGQLELLAMLGADVTGIEVDPLLPLLYEKDNGPVTAKDGTKGKLRVLHGYFPTDKKLVAAAGTGYDLFISKNTLKKGYINPDRPIEKDKERMLIKLGVSDAEFVGQVFKMLNPGGYFFIYNLTPAPTPAGQPFLPWSDGRSPFSKETYEKAGFTVIHLDVDDTPAARAMGKAFGWDLPWGDEPGTNLEKDLFGQYTLVRRPLEIR